MMTANQQPHHRIPFCTCCASDSIYSSLSRSTGSKVELEALYTLSVDALSGRFLETAVLREDYI